MQDWMKDINYYLMPSRNPVKGYEEQYKQAYECWRSAWEKFRSEIGVKDKLTSDGFLLPDEIGALFYQGKCVGLSAFTFGTLNSGPMPDLSWFNGWSDISYQKLKNISTNAIICSQFTVSPEFTGKGQIIRWKDMISLYSLMRFHSSNSDVMAGHLNLTRKVDDACGESSGATVLDPCKTFSYYGVEIPAQLVAYEKHSIELVKQKKNIDGQWDQLWNQVTHLSDLAFINQSAVPAKKVA